MKSGEKPKRRNWLAELIVALMACCCLLVYFYPGQNYRLYCIEGHESPDGYYETQGIFPGSQFFMNRCYRVVKLTQQPTRFLLDMEMPGYYTQGHPLRLWILLKDHQRIQDNPDLTVRVFALEVFNSDTQQWTRYTPEHPRGNGLFLAAGIVLVILFLVMGINKLCFTSSVSTGRT